MQQTISSFKFYSSCQVNIICTINSFLSNLLIMLYIQFEKKNVKFDTPVNSC